VNHRKIFDNEGSLYMGSQRNIKESSIGIFGVNYDGTTSFKPGTRFGPNAIRNVSQSLETYCPRLDKDLSNIKYVDFGSLIIDLNNTESVIKKVSIATKALLENNLKPLMLGGEHSITTGAIEALVEKYPDLVLIQLDAHADLRESYLNNINSHACTMQRCIEKLPNKKIFQLGIRSGTKEEFKKMRENKQLIDFHEVNRESLLKALEKVKKFPIYLTIDLDWFDPSLLPGTGTPEPGGFFWNDFEVVVETLNNFNLIGADIVELSPEIDLSGVSSIVAAKVTRSLIMTLDN
tara:strand:+ start:1767 stop:2642 length:876 start_codon:yes stop_codon:yes gene_type:complete